MKGVDVKKLFTPSSTVYNFEAIYQRTQALAWGSAFIVVTTSISLA